MNEFANISELVINKDTPKALKIGNVNGDNLPFKCVDKII